MLRTKVKASAITNLTDARYFAAFEVEWLGFRLDPSHERYLAPRTAGAIREWVDGVRIAGEFEMQSAAEIRTAAELLQLDAVQVGMLTPVETLIELQSPRPIIREIVIEATTTTQEVSDMLEQNAPYCAFFLFNFDKNDITWAALSNNEHPIALGELRNFCEQYPVLLSIDLTTDSLQEVLDALPIAGLNFTGGEEEKVGYKSFDELDELLEALTVEEGG